ncbi:ketosynthase chain-length factor [Paractinoplanes toevensis]|uniref:Actinorhodin polyketide putative beta-ketoacyl synthase 2 n=1 Tax=Paractinoplanes toevensis TaxID=571911 RepID=A0A919TAU7_9ACTN|nr:ketosynthase chain-length factor [Actinoplanes toevensis]GIM92604.1 actinorhodin polyketide putative beta-ketoacyl synthase 2 [Actinoplanes toevensis]
MTVVITGMSAIAPNGLGTDEYWAATLRGRSGIRRISRFETDSYPVKLGGEITDFQPREHVPGRLVPQTDRVTQYALAATGWALADAGTEPEETDPYDFGVLTASGCGGFEFGQRELQKLWSEGPHRVSAYQSFAWFYAVNTGQISIRHGARGHSSVLVTEQAGGLDALAAARRHLRRGTMRTAISGGLDAPLSPWGLTAQIPNGLLSTADDPATAYRPFGSGAGGYVAGEGGAILVLETKETARRRGRDGYAEVAGYAATFDPSPRSGRPSNLAATIRGALDDAGCAPGDVDAVLADGLGTTGGDTAEAAAITEVFGDHRVPVTVPKTLTGRLYAGGAALDVVCGALMLRDQVIPATHNVTEVPGEYRIDLVRGSHRETPVRSVLVLARGHGGFNSALLLRAVPTAH